MNIMLVVPSTPQDDTLFFTYMKLSHLLIALMSVSCINYSGMMNPLYCIRGINFMTVLKSNKQ